MVRNTRFAMLLVYLLLAFSGVIFTLDPVNSIQSIFAGSRLISVWGGFYITGGLTASAAVVIRILQRNLLATWFFELAGLALLVMATIIYFLALTHLSAQRNDPGVVGTSVVVLALATSLVVRISETIALSVNLRKIENRFKTRGRGEK